jgi:hypothetical protein
MDMHILVIRMNRTSIHSRAIDAAIDSLDGAFFKALCEPSRALDPPKTIR